MATNAVGKTVAALAALFLFGCGNSTSRPTSQPSSGPSSAVSASSLSPTALPAGMGMIVGHVMRGPGRDPRSGSASPTIPVSGDPVQVRGTGNKLAASAVTTPDGSFQVKLSPGWYTVSEDIAGISKLVQVKEQMITNLTLHLPSA